MYTYVCYFLLLIPSAEPALEANVDLQGVEGSIRSILERHKAARQDDDLVVATFDRGTLVISGDQNVKLSAELVIISERKPGKHSLFVKELPQPADSALDKVKTLCAILKLDFADFRTWRESRDFELRKAIKRSGSAGKHTATLEMRNAFNDDFEWNVIVTVSERVAE